VFERFTDRARRALVLAQEEARELDHAFIGPEHILLGLLHEGDGVAARALGSLGITIEGVRERVRGATGESRLTGGVWVASMTSEHSSSEPRPRRSPPRPASSGSTPFTPRAKKVLELSLREALQLGHSYIGTEHMLLGIVREGDSVAAQALESTGTELREIRARVLQMISGSYEPTGEGAHGAQLLSSEVLSTGGRSGGDVLLSLLWRSGMIRDPRNEAEQAIWNELKARFEPEPE